MYGYGKEFFVVFLGVSVSFVSGVRRKIAKQIEG